MQQLPAREQMQNGGVRMQLGRSHSHLTIASHRIASFIFPFHVHQSKGRVEIKKKNQKGGQKILEGNEGARKTTSDLTHFFMLMRQKGRCTASSHNSPSRLN